MALTRLHPSLLGLILLASPVAAQDATATLARLDSLWAGAYASHDTALALSLMSERFVMTSGSGRVKTRAEELGDVRGYPGLTVPFFRSADRDIRVHGATGVIIGRLEWAVERSDGSRSDVKLRYTATWARGGEHGWQLVALQVSPPLS